MSIYKLFVYSIWYAIAALGRSTNSYYRHYGMLHSHSREVYYTPDTAHPNDEIIYLLFIGFIFIIILCAASLPSTEKQTQRVRFNTGVYWLFAIHTIHVWCSDVWMVSESSKYCSKTTLIQKFLSILFNKSCQGAVVLSAIYDWTVTYGP